jgi:hypothetical protein
MAGPDLTEATATVEAIMDDACTIVHDPTGFADDTFDRVTGTWLRPVPDGSTVYSGKCFASRGGGGHDQLDAERPKSITRLVLKLPVGSSAPPGSVCTFTASLRNPFLIDTTWRVVSEESSTFSVTHRVRLERLVDSLTEQADQ